ncbi:hypothetical protein ACA910_014432 [Epithemia clementina (nom. ined.)]
MLSMGISKRKSPTNRGRSLKSATTSGLLPSDDSPSISQGQKRKRLSRQGSIIDIAPRFLLVCSVTGSLVVVMVVLQLAVNSNSVKSPHHRFHKNLTVQRASHHPRIYHFLGHESHPSRWDSFVETLRSSVHNAPPKAVMPLISKAKELEVADSFEYQGRQADVFETSECKAMFPWQLQTFPTCNSMHETDLIINAAKTSAPVFLTSGFWRDVWLLHNATLYDRTVVLKTLRFMHNVTLRNLDRNRRDALVMERLTKSPWILDVYGFCGNAGFYEYADGGDISTALWPKALDELQQKRKMRHVNNLMTRQQKLEIGVQAAIGLAELHNFDGEGRATVAHTDISPAQYVNVRGRYKLQDFNRVRFIRWSKSANQTCPYNVSSNPGKNRSPEEYKYQPQTEMVDVYSLGNLFYMLLQMEWPFKDETTQKAKDLVQDGYRPSFYEDVWNSDDPYDVTLKKAMLMCHEQEPANRSSAREVANYLKTQLETLNPGVLQTWGESISTTQ